MICTRCATASDQRAPRDQHCDDAGCMCGHRVKRYGTTTAKGAAGQEDAMPKLTVNHIVGVRRVSVCESGRHSHHLGQTCAEVDAEPAIEALIGEHLSAMYPEYADATRDRCRAEYHEANRPSARCDLPAGHAEHHRDISGGGFGFHWGERVAIYPTDATPED